MRSNALREHPYVISLRLSNRCEDTDCNSSVGDGGDDANAANGVALPACVTVWVTMPKCSTAIAAKRARKHHSGGGSGGGGGGGRAYAGCEPGHDGTGDITLFDAERLTMTVRTIVTCFAIVVLFLISKPFVTLSTRSEFQSIIEICFCVVCLFVSFAFYFAAPIDHKAVYKSLGFNKPFLFAIVCKATGVRRRRVIRRHRRRHRHT
jgi:hypothetical protein